MNDDGRLKAKLLAIEALYAGATTPGEREAAERARERIRARISAQPSEPLREWQMSVDPWTRRLLLVLLQRYGLKPYRYPRQRRTTVLFRAPESFVRQVFFPEFEAMAHLLAEHLTEVTDQVLAEALGAKPEEPGEREGEPKQLEAFQAAEPGE